MKLTKKVFWILFFQFSFVDLFCQDTLIFQPSNWYPLAGTTEQYTVSNKDTLQRPHGKYEWKYLSESENGGVYKLGFITAEFDHGLANGPFKCSFVDLNFEITSFDMSGVNATTRGNQSRVEGYYQQGKPTGKWVFETGPWQDSIYNQRVIFNTEDRILHFKDSKFSFIGSIDQSGLMDGQWSWIEKGRDTIHYIYHHGILSGFKVGEKSLLNHVFNQINNQIPISGNQNLKPTNSWIWNPGIPIEDSVYSIQTPLINHEASLSLPYRIAEASVLDHPLFMLPEFQGTAVYCFELSTKNNKQLQENIHIIDNWVNQLTNEIYSPIFELRRLSEPKVDTLIESVTFFLSQLDDLRLEIEQFTEDSAREIVPYFLSTDSDLRFDSHDAYAEYLHNETLKQNDIFEGMMHDIAFRKSIFRFQGTLDELEAEWISIYNDIEITYKSNDSHPIAENVFQNIVVVDYIEQKYLYGQIESLSDRKDFLSHNIENYQYLLEFFQNRKYEEINDVNTFFINHYTTYLYNPYMNENNIKVLRKKKFIKQIIDHFWPYLINKFLYIENIYQLQELMQKMEKYKSGLVLFADENSFAAKRLEKRVRKEKNMSRIDALLYEYFND